MRSKRMFEVCATLLMLACSTGTSFAGALVEVGRFYAPGMTDYLKTYVPEHRFGDMNGDGWKEYLHRFVNQPCPTIINLRTDERIPLPDGCNTDAVALYDIDGNGRAELLIQFNPVVGPSDTVTVFRWTEIVDADPSVDASTIVSLGVLPNPSNAAMAVIVSGAKGQTLTLDVFDVNGRKVASIFQGKPTDPIQRFDWTPSLPSGVYFLCAEGDQFEIVSRAVLVR